MSEKTDRFLQLYGAHLGPLREDDGRDYFLAWVAQESISLGLLEQVLQRLGALMDDGRMPRKPRFGRIRHDYDELAGRSTSRSAVARDPVCTKCARTGYVNIVVAGRTIGLALPMNRHHPQNFAYMASSTIPCDCPRGMRINDKHGDEAYPIPALQQMHRNYVFPMSAVGNSSEFIVHCRTTLERHETEASP